MSHSKVVITLLPTLPELEENQSQELEECCTRPDTKKMSSRMMNLRKSSTCLVIVCIVLISLCTVLVQPHPIESEDQLNADPESLPPDTFRKLAQALYHRDGDKPANRLQRKFFYSKNVTCNDGSTAGYYIRRNYESKRWIVFLEGGWICHDELSCAERAGREMQRMSSHGWPSVRSIGGILSADPEENPHFADANHVFVPYCSSDSWSGTATVANKDGFTFMGRHIIHEVVRELSDNQQLLFAEELFLAGSSAGATGVLVNADFVADLIRPRGVRVRGIVDSGWFLDNDPFNEDASVVIRSLQRGIRLWQANVNDQCARNYPDDLWQCYIGYKAFPFIKTPLFIFQWQFDQFQLYADNVPIPATPDQWEYIHNIGSKLRSTFNDLNAVFSPACIAHNVITKLEWTQVVVDGVSLPDALWCWSSSLPDAVMMSSTNLQISSGKLIQESSNEVAAISRQRSMLADAPGKKRRHEREHPKKLNSNLIRLMNAPSETEETSRNSLNPHNHKRRNRNHKVTDNRTGFHAKKPERRRQRLLRKCREGNENACRRLENQPKNNNKDLIRSLDRRSSKKQKLSRKERRKLRRQEKRHKRRERKRQRRRMKKNKNKNSREKRSPAPAPQCRTKFIDSCSWPHCNRSCPKLKNMETGQEIDFLSLLKSFGLEMSNVAKALKVDINTLNNMDKEYLMDMLTSAQQQN